MSKRGGKKAKRGKKTKDDSNFKRELILKDDLQCYGLINKMLGDRRVDVYCYDGKNRIGSIRGNMKRKVWINMGDTVLISLREFEDKKCDVIHKYSDDEVRVLKKKKEIPVIKETTEDELDSGGKTTIEFSDL